jgi:hypothetical protein
MKKPFQANLRAGRQGYVRMKKNSLARLTNGVIELRNALKLDIR